MNDIPTKAASPRGFSQVRAAILAPYAESALRYQALAVATQAPWARTLARIAELRLSIADASLTR